MRDVETSRFVQARRPVVTRALDPAAIVEYEGSFRVRNVEEREDGKQVTAGGGGIELELWFEEREDGYYYEQQRGGPLDELWTTIAVAPEDDGVRVTARSGVSLGVPVPGADRIAAWKRRGELERMLENLAEAVE